MDDTWIAIGASGIAAVTASTLVIAPTSRKLIETLRALVEAAMRADAERYRAQIEAHDPFRTGRFEHKHVTGMLKADFAPFGPECQRLHTRAKQLDRRAHYGMLPLGLFALGCLWWWLQA